MFKYDGITHSSAMEQYGKVREHETLKYVGFNKKKSIFTKAIVFHGIAYVIGALFIGRLE